MELEGLKRSVAFVNSEDLVIGQLVTDRHRQIAKWLRGELPDTLHLYDVWHVAKGRKHDSVRVILELSAN